MDKHDETTKCPRCHEKTPTSAFQSRRVTDAHESVEQGTWPLIPPTLFEPFPQVMPGQPLEQGFRRFTVGYAYRCKKCGNEWEETREETVAG
jgi:DNA-directed RNA polymerase subunit RPC12/RpoP